jgi:hypothetical protein
MPTRKRYRYIRKDGQLSKPYTLEVILAAARAKIKEGNEPYMITCHHDDSDTKDEVVTQLANLLNRTGGNSVIHVLNKKGMVEFVIHVRDEEAT